MFHNIMPRRKTYARKKSGYTDKQKIAYYRKLAREAKAHEQTHVVQGQGAYTLPRNFFSAKKLGGYLGGAAGTAIGSMIAPGIGTEMGGSIGNAGGQYLGRLFKKITGWGDYNVNENSLVHGDAAVPSFGEDSIRVRKREYILGINSDATTFTNHVFAINPGVAETFPWLSNIAANYEQYRVNGMIFEYISTSSDAIAAATNNLGMGQVILATEYNAGDDPFQDSAQMLNYTFSNSNKPSEHILHAIECAPNDTAQTLYYTRSGAVPDGQDPRLYDLGLFQIATDNMPSAYTGMGQLWVSYDITFCKAQANNALGFEILNDFFQFSTGIDNSHPFGTAVDPATPAAGSILGMYIDQDTLYFPDHLQSGYYLVQIAWRGSATALTGPIFTGINCLGVDCFVPTECKMQAPANSVSSARINVSTIVKLNTAGTGVQCTIGLGSQVLPTSATACYVTVTQLNGDIYDSFALSATNQW